MIDTVKILIPIHDPEVMSKLFFQPISAKQLKTSYGSSRTYYNPPKAYAKQGIYMPNLTMFRRPNRQRRGATYELAVEFSAPKMLYGNNFDELVERDFEKLVRIISDKLLELSGHRFFPEQIKKAKVNGWHPSKNIVFLDYTSAQTVLGAIAKLDVSRVYDLQKTDFRDGHVVHIHTNSLDIALYDKMADLRKSKISDKRALEKDNSVQLSLLDELEDFRPLEVFRFEVRYSGIAAIKRAYPELTSWIFEDLFKEELCKASLQKHWRRLTSSVDLIALDLDKPHQLLQNYLEDNPDVTPQTALAAVAGLMVVGQEGTVGLRNTIETVYGPAAWYRVKKLLKAPTKHRYKSFIKIEETLERFTPVSMKDFRERIENTV